MLAWRIDIQLNTNRDGRVVNRRWPAHLAPLEDITWVATDTVRYLDPAITLLFKAKVRRPKDELDFAAALPLLGDTQRTWLRDALRAVHPGHPWLARVSG